MSRADVIPFYALDSLHEAIGEEIDGAVAQVMASGRFILGEECAAFEREFAAYCDSRHCVGVGSGLDALTLILKGFGIGPGDKVIVPANTFIASWLAVSYAGAEVVPVDFGHDPSGDELKAVEAALDASVKAIIVVHLYGIPVNIEPFLSLAKKTSIKLIEDAAQAHGATFNARKVGSLADAAAFSFYPAKNLGALGDGGAVTTDSEELASHIRKYSNYGSDAKYDHEIMGVNSRLDELQAAVLRVKLKHLDQWNEARRVLAASYGAALVDLPLELVREPAGASSVWHLYPVLLERRDEFREFMLKRGVELGVHYPRACHHQGAYEHMFDSALFPQAREICRRTISLPMGPMLSQNQQGRVVSVIGDWFSKAWSTR